MDVKKLQCVAMMAAMAMFFGMIGEVKAQEWFEQESGTDKNLMDIAIISSEKGWAVGEEGIILYTEDYGANWQKQESGTTNNLRAVDFVDSETGWVVGDEGKVLHTNNGGESWESLESSTNSSLEDIDVINSEVAWIVGNGGTILFTDDGGQSWQDISYGSNNLKGVAFIDSETGWVVGGWGSNRVLHTSDGGENWEYQESPAELYRLRDVDVVDDQTSWAVGDEDLIIHTENSGIDWETQTLSMNYMLHGVLFIDDEKGWVVGRGIGYTKDGGENWHNQEINIDEELKGIDFLDSKTGWVVGDNGTILHYTDDSREVTFSVDMSVQEAHGIYRSEEGDKIELHGEFNEWGENDLEVEYILEEAGDYVYSTKINVLGFKEYELDYNFKINPGDDRNVPNDGLENIIRSVILDPADESQELETVLFNDEPFQYTNIPEADSLALTELYEATDGNDWQENRSWMEWPVESWYGISVDDDRVTGIELPENALEGELPEELTDLDLLERFHVAENELSGELNLFTESWSELRKLQVQGNELEGSLELSSSNFESINVAGNKLNGGLPEVLSESEYLEILDVSQNEALTGMVPEGYAELEEVQQFDYSGTQIRTPLEEQIFEWLQRVSWGVWKSGLVDLDAPGQITPHKEEVGVPHTPLLSWHSMESVFGYGVDHFDVLVRADSADGEVVFEDQGISHTNVVADLDYHTDYYWQVRAVMETWGRGHWSEPRAFTTRLEEDLAPELEGPAHETDEVEIPARLTWHELEEEDATGYHIEVSHTPDFDTSFVVKGYEDTEAEIEELVADTTTYFWRVRAEVDQQLTSWSSTWSFTTELRPPETPEWQPEDGDTDVDDLLVKWSEAERAETYNLQLAEDEDFDELVFDESGLEETEFELQEDQLDPNTTYHWRISAENESGDSGWSEALSFTTAETVTAEADQEIPDEFGLEANYPNPFNPDTQISYQLAEDAEVTLRVYDTLGREVATLVNTHQSAGKYEVSFDASNLSSGTYIYRIEAGGFVESRQMMLVK